MAMAMATHRTMPFPTNDSDTRCRGNLSRYVRGIRVIPSVYTSGRYELAGIPRLRMEGRPMPCPETHAGVATRSLATIPAVEPLVTRRVFILGSTIVCKSLRNLRVRVPRDFCPSRLDGYGHANTRARRYTRYTEPGSKEQHGPSSRRSPSIGS